jgi:hypothetical protein
MQKYADFIKAKIEPLDITVEMDIPFWLDEYTVNSDNKELPVNEVVFRYADAVVIMSYRDTAQKTLEVCKEEIALAKKYGKKIVVGQATYSEEGNQVSYAEEGKAVMDEENSKIYAALTTEIQNRNFGVAIHDMKHYFELK